MADKIKIDPEKVIKSHPKMVKEGIEFLPKFLPKFLWQIIIKPFEPILSIFNHDAHKINKLK